jgi:hypothetical protein
MKKLSVVLFVLLFAFGANAQTAKSKRPVLPANIANFKDSFKLVNDAAVKSRLKKLLGKKGYADFLESWETINPIVKKDGILFASGCLIHACGHIESAIAIDLKTKTIHVGIFRQDETSKIYDEYQKKPPKVLSDWLNNLSEMNK